MSMLTEPTTGASATEGTRTLKYTEAVCQATHQAMEADDRVLLFGLGVDDPKAILGTTAGLPERFGPDRIFDTPLSEDAMTGVAIGLALAGFRPIHVHIRMDFLMLAMNQLVNIAAKSRYMYGGQHSVPLVVRSMIGKSWGQGAQHSQALHALFMHVPGLRVVTPATPYDAKGCLLQAVQMDDPVMFIEHRILHYLEGPVPEAPYTVAPGKARVVTEGSDVTLVGVSYMQLESFRAAKYLERVGISAEVIDPIWLAPLDLDTIVESVRKTGRLVVADNGWTTCGASSEIIARVAEALQGQPIAFRRVGFPMVPCPTTPALENHFYPNARKVASVVHEMVKGEAWMPDEDPALKDAEFKGPF